MEKDCDNGKRLWEWKEIVIIEKVCDKKEKIKKDCDKTSC